MSRRYEEGRKYLDLDNYTKALEIYTQGDCEGDACCSFGLAQLFFNGWGVEKDEGRASEIFARIMPTLEKMANNGNVYAQDRIAVAYNNGYFFSKDNEKAFFWVKKAAEQGYVKAQNNLGICYENGYGVEQDYQKAVEWYTKAAEQGNAGAQYNLGVCYKNGEGVEQDYQKAVELYTKAAEQGNALAQNNLGICYENGNGVEQDYQKAVELYTKAAENGYALAQNNLGICYYNGEGVGQDYFKAVEWFQRAIQGDKPCCESFYYLGDYYHNGYGGKQELKKAKEHYLLAAENGYNCRYALEMVEKDLSLETFYNEELKKLPESERRKEWIARDRARKRYEKQESEKGIRALMKEIAKKGYTNPERMTAIAEDLQKEFGDTWSILKENAQKSLVTAFFIYSVFLDMGREFYEELDFSPVINQLSKAYETELREFFYKGYLRFLKHKGVNCHEFVKKDEEQQLAIIYTEKDRKTKEKRYRYCKEENEKEGSFSLGSFHYLIGTQDLPKLAVAGLKTRKVMDYNDSSRTVNKYILEYALELFAEDAFSEGNRKKEIVNYLIDIASDAKTIKDYRNPGAHDKTMSIDEAAVTADYLVKIHKVLKQFMEKINPKYLEKGYYVEE